MIKNTLNYVIDRLVDWIIPLDNFGPLTDDNEVNWWYNNIMIYQVGHVFADKNPIKVTDLLGTNQISQFAVQMFSEEGNAYIGNENVSEVSYGFRLRNDNASVYFPQIDLQLNNNLYISGDPGVSINFLAWE